MSVMESPFELEPALAAGTCNKTTIARTEQTRASVMNSGVLELATPPRAMRCLLFFERRAEVGSEFLLRNEGVLSACSGYFSTQTQPETTLSQF